MNSSQSSHRAGAFTLVELLCVIAIISILFALMLPVFDQGKARAKRIACINNLRQTGIAFQSFVHDHGDRFPMAVPMVEGGSYEFVRNGYAVGGEFYFSFRQFQVLSNELVVPAILICPTDTRLPATNFGVLQNSNLSYFVGVKATYSKPDAILAGDRHLTADSLPNPSILHIATNNPLRWMPELHRFGGNIMFAGGQVEEWNNTMLASRAGSEYAGADLFMPTVLPGPNAPVSGGYGNYPGGNPGVGTVSPTPAATPAYPATTPAYPATTPASPVTRPADNYSGSQGRVGRQTPDRPGTPSLPDRAGKSPSDLFSTNAPDGETVTSEKADDSTTLTFDQRVTKTLRRSMIEFYLLAWLIFLLWLLFVRRRKSKRKQAQRENQD
jgi:prepilin-type N-terminal cleavage/methylation domain-containing protein